MADIFNSSTLIVVSFVSQIAVIYPAVQFAEEDGLNTAHHHLRCVSLCALLVLGGAWMMYLGVY